MRKGHESQNVPSFSSSISSIICVYMSVIFLIPLLVSKTLSSMDLQDKNVVSSIEASVLNQNISQKGKAHVSGSSSSRPESGSWATTCGSTGGWGAFGRGAAKLVRGFAMGKVLFGGDSGGFSVVFGTASGFGNAGGALLSWIPKAVLAWIVLKFCCGVEKEEPGECCSVKGDGRERKFKPGELARRLLSGGMTGPLEFSKPRAMRWELLGGSAKELRVGTGCFWAAAVVGVEKDPGKEKAKAELWAGAFVACVDERSGAERAKGLFTLEAVPLGSTLLFSVAAPRRLRLKPPTGASPPSDRPPKLNIRTCKEGFRATVWPQRSNRLRYLYATGAWGNVNLDNFLTRNFDLHEDSCVQTR